MIPVAKLKQNLDFNKNLGELIEVMKLAATLQFNQFRANRQPSVDFISLFESTYGHIAENKTRNIFLESSTRDADSASAIILISSDEGFLGELNTILVNKLIEKRHSDDTVIVIGEQGANYLRELNIDAVPFASITDKLEFKQIEALRDYVLERYVKGEVARVHVIYARFVNITSQQIESEDLLPLSASFFPQSERKKGEFLIEPDLDSVIEGWVKLWLFFKFYQIFWLSKLAEFAARIMHLEGSIQELNRINQRLKMEYFKYLHGLSDKTIREISASRLVRKS